MKDASMLKDARLFAIFALYDLHTDFFRKALDGISNDDAHNRLGTKANHGAWIAGSIVESRFEGCRNVGVDIQSSSHEFFKDHQGIQDQVTYPPIVQYLRDWDKVTPILREKTLEKDTEWLDECKDMGRWKATNLEMINFMTYREANMIGQIALWRRLLGYGPMNYM